MRSSRARRWRSDSACFRRSRGWHRSGSRNGGAIRTALLVTIVIVLAIIALRRHTAVVALAVLAVALWMCTAEITSARGSSHQAQQFVDNLPKPLNWLDTATHKRGTTYLGQDVND